MEHRKLFLNMKKKTIWHACGYNRYGLPLFMHPHPRVDNFFLCRGSHYFYIWCHSADGNFCLIIPWIFKQKGVTDDTPFGAGQQNHSGASSLFYHVKKLRPTMSALKNAVDEAKKKRGWATEMCGFFLSPDYLMDKFRKQIMMFVLWVDQYWI